VLQNNRFDTENIENIENVENAEKYFVK